jgi:uncharacterized membrane protein YdjX (TVP38/TMEM64 family)
LKTSQVLIALVLGLALLAGFALDLGGYLSLAQVKQTQAELQALYVRRPWTVLGLYALVYTLVFALAVPVGAVMSMVGGALFGFGVGVALVALASTTGATLTFLAVRHGLAEPLRRRLGSRLAAVDAGVRRDGGFYLFTLRLTPGLPPGMINLLFGLTPLPTFTFVWVSALGMLAGTLVFVNAGTQLARVDSVQGILTPGLALAMLALGLFPLVARHATQALSARRRRAA